ncbi:MAG: tRNA pseudouridine(55) synthase TruB [Acidobacteriota bacterium]|jgi:tRNA pseudouridine55 synthase
MHDGLLLIDKDPGFTSHDVVQKVRNLVRQKKVGHCGTLDPSATGLLLLTLGKATRLTRFLIRAPKVYEGTVRFGAVTDTYDATGEVTAERSTEGLTREAVAEAMAGLEGTIEHAAPPYSAKKVKGKKLYELARQGEEVPRETKQVTVYEFSPQGDLERGDADADDGGAPRIGFRLGCASGTYARTLAHDLGRAVGCGAHLGSLRRIKIGPFELASAVTIEELGERLRRAVTEVGEDATVRSLDDLAPVLGDAWIPFDAIPLPFDRIVTDHQQEERVRHGQTVLVREMAGEEGDWIKLMNRRDELIAVGTVIERIGERGVGIIQPRVVFK